MLQTSMAVWHRACDLVSVRVGVLVCVLQLPSFSTTHVSWKLELQ